MERLYLDNYFSITKTQRDLGYQPLFITEQAMAECVPYHVDLFHQMKAESARAGRQRGHGSSARGLISPVALLTRAARSRRARSGSTSITAATTSGS